jgi:hypothetical protein
MIQLMIWDKIWYLWIPNLLYIRMIVYVCVFLCVCVSVCVLVRVSMCMNVWVCVCVSVWYLFSYGNFHVPCSLSLTCIGTKSAMTLFVRTTNFACHVVPQHTSRRKEPSCFWSSDWAGSARASRCITLVTVGHGFEWMHGFRPCSDGMCEFGFGHEVKMEE